MPTIGLNAQLLSMAASYRGAGIAHYIHQLVAHLPAAEAGFWYALFAPDSPGPLPRVQRYRSLLPTQRPPIRILWEQFFQPWGLARAGCDLVHGMAYALPLAWRGPAVVTIYDLSFVLTPGHFRGYNRVYLAQAVRHAVRQAQMVCAISHQTSRDIQRVYGVSPDRVAVVYPGCDPRFRPQPPEAVAAFRHQRGLPERFILYLGTLEPRKNLVNLLRAYAALPGAPPLVMAGGKGWDYAVIFAEVERLGLRDRVIFPGFVPQAEQPLWYAAATCFVYPSYYEGFGLPPLEAMACGTPVITSDAASLPEVVGDAGMMVPPDAPEALTEALAILLQEPDRRAAMRERGLAQAARFNWAASAAQQARVYRRVLGLDEAAAAPPVTVAPIP